jgi:hypothetical protein
MQKLLLPIRFRGWRCAGHPLTRSNEIQSQGDRSLRPVAGEEVGLALVLETPGDDDAHDEEGAISKVNEGIGRLKRWLTHGGQLRTPDSDDGAR